MYLQNVKLKSNLIIVRLISLKGFNYTRMYLSTLYLIEE